ncbi:Glycosyltransferase Family 22 protein [Trametes cinnabarina]|uniref:Mannosyltransferase n=1 Tax=Pycnoporus cinnabarinus TaxID=5643 RepID=A0A060SH83_PYCCI|nr:Glycosyltransferase Family 22 protein [Trametes cinnabarina]
MASFSAAGSAQSMSESRAEALQALLNSLSPGAQAHEGGKLNPDQVRRISDKLGELLGEDAMPDVGRRNEKGELLNEEGLPIVDIVEPVSGDTALAAAGFRPSLPEADYIPLWRLPPEEQARRRAERDRILDMLEAEELAQQEREEKEERERFQAELEKRKVAAKAEMDALKKAREMQKKMGKALLQNMAAAREREEKEKQAMQQAEEQAREERKKLKPKKSVTFADLPPEHENQPANSVHATDWGDVAPAKLNAGKSTLITRGQMDKLPMKMNVVERTPGSSRGPKSPPPPTSSQADSDDESVPGSPIPADSDDGEAIRSELSDSDSPPPSNPEESDDSDLEPPENDEPVEWDVEGYDFAQHQREIALAYYEKRATIGAEALAAVRNHEHDQGEHEWDQPMVPLEASLASSPPKQVSRFKTSRPSSSTLASHSLGGSILPSSQGSTLKSAVRLGKLENGQLVGGDDGESDDELDPQAKEVLEILKKGEVVNVGPTIPAGGIPGTSPSTPVPAQPATAPKPKPSKVSQIKMSLGQSTPPQTPSSPSSSLTTPVSNLERSSPKLGSRGGTPIPVPTKTSRPPSSSSKRPEQHLPQMPGMFVDSPSFPGAAQPAQMPGMIVDSPSFPAPGQRSRASGKQPMQMPGMVVDSPSFPAQGIVANSAVIESPSFTSPSFTVGGAPVSGIPPSAATRASATPRTPVGATVLERKPPSVGVVKDSHVNGAQTDSAAPKKKVSSLPPNHMHHLTLAALAVRIGIALATCTFFQPDEYYQSLEVAHHLVFGYGQLTWEWLAPKPIRSIVYPALNVPIYWLLKSIHLDGTAALIWGPKLLHGVLAACTDVWLMRLTRRLIGERYVNAALFFSLTSFFHGLSLSRSISNSAETSLTTVALSYFPWDTYSSRWRHDVRKALLVAGLACAIRPTNAVLWVYMFGWLLWSFRERLSDVAYLTVTAGFTGTLILLAIIILDSSYYGKLTLTPINFLLTNASSVSLFYGRSPWHYYLTQAIPILAATALPWVLHGAYLATRPTAPIPLRVLLGLLVWTVSMYSLAGHKEWRFIHPLLPLMHILASKSFVDWHRAGDRSSSKSRVASRLFVVLSIPAICYVALFHGRAQVAVMQYLKTLSPETSASIGFLMPCHSTPWQAYLHRKDLASDGMLWALGCEPPLQGQDVLEYKDQTDVFYESPMRYLKTRFPASVNLAFPPSPLPRSKPGLEIPKLHPWRHEWPQNLVFFGALLEEPGLQELFLDLGYREVWKAEYGWEGDNRRKGGVRVWRIM